MPAPPLKLSVVIPTLRNHDLLARVLAGYARQDRAGFEVIVVADRAEPDPDAVQRAIGERPFPVRALSGASPGASANRNAGWHAARAPLVLFTDDDTIPAPDLVARHLAAHARHPAEADAVLGHVRWARDLRVTPFMRWLEQGIQFDYGAITGSLASWAHLYSSNSSLKRALLERLGGYDELRFPYGYEDLDLGLRGREHGLRVHYERRAIVEHARAMTLATWQARAPRLAHAERRFCQRHPEIDPWFLKLFSEAAMAPAQRGRAARLAGVVPRSTPYLGPLVWHLADLYWRQQIASPFLAAWEQAADAAPAPGTAALAERAGEDES